MDGFNRGGCGGTGGAGCSCYDCEEWRRYCYWNHDHAGGGGGTKQFLLFASDDKDHLCLPREVTSQLRDMISDSEPIKLGTPDGRTYDVEFAKFGQITLKTGWRGFVDANHIRQGDPMLFVYCGGSSFKVHILSSSGHGNSLPCSQQPPDIFRAVPPRDCHVLNEQVVPDPAHVRMSTNFGYTAFPGTRLTKAQETKVLDLADSSMRSEIPLHVAAVNKRNANEDCYVYIPLRLLDNFKEGITEATIQLEAHGKNMLYSVGASKHGDDQIILQSELTHFVACHRIQDNDLLVFRSKEKACLEVLVLDPSGCEKTCFAMGNSSNAREGYRAKAQNMASTSFPCAKSGYTAGRSNEPPMSNKIKVSYMVSGSRPLTTQQEKIVKEKVRAIGSEFPVFVNVMTACSVREPVQSLRFSRKYGSVCLPPKETPLRLCLEGSELHWSTKLVIGRFESKDKWIFKGWTDLVLEAELQEGDICLVELADRSSKSFTMTVHLIRKSEIQP